MAGRLWKLQRTTVPPLLMTVNRTSHVSWTGELDDHLLILEAAGVEVGYAETVLSAELRRLRGDDPSSEEKGRSSSFSGLGGISSFHSTDFEDSATSALDVGSLTSTSDSDGYGPALESGPSSEAEMQERPLPGPGSGVRFDASARGVGKK